MTVLPATVPPLPREKKLARNLPARTAFAWLRAGWQDTIAPPHFSLVYGFAVFLISFAIVWTLFTFRLDYILFPALAGFMVVGPVIATGLYEKSRLLARQEPMPLRALLLVRAKSGGQIFLIGVILTMLALLWMRAAVIIYALFFGLRPFPGLDHIAAMLFLTPLGWAMLLVGTLVGGLFAAFAFSISVFAVPMLLDERVDALTAMGTSMAMVWNNLPIMLAWGAIVLAMVVATIATGLAGFVLTFPLLGHATWHAYRTIRR